MATEAPSVLQVAQPQLLDLLFSLPLQQKVSRSRVLQWLQFRLLDEFV
jgi:hypothetical protein